MALFGLYFYGMLHAWKLMKRLRRLRNRLGMPGYQANRA
jgi:hypothetical protein